MRVLRLSVFLIVLGLLPGLASADFSIFGSYIGTDTFDENYGGGARFSLGNRVQFQLSGTYYDSFERSSPTVSVDALPIDAGIRFNLGQGPLYTGFGATYFLLDSQSGKLPDEYGYYLTLGFQLKSGLFVETIWRDVDGSIEGSNTASGVVPVDLEGWTVNLGYCWGCRR